MNSRSDFLHTPVRFFALGLLAFVLLTIRFSPNWVTFCLQIRDARLSVSGPAQNAAFDKAILSGYSVRGFYVTQQAHDLSTEIEDSTHKIVRWRLLVPILGHFLRLPDWFILSLPHLGCLALIFAFVTIGMANPDIPGHRPHEPICFGIVAGATAPFFASMGLLGNFDSWLALALVGVAFARRRWVVLIACILAPWLDERFVIGFPVAMCVRRMLTIKPAECRWAWFKEQALAPFVIVACYSIVRLKLGGSGGSQTIEQYLNQFVLSEKLTVTQRLYGGWEGLRFAWALVLVAIVGSWRSSSEGIRVEVVILTAGVAVTGLIGLYIAQDVGRTMVLLIPVVPLGWIYSQRLTWWSRFHGAFFLALGALLLPANHVLGKSIVPVDNVWMPSLPLITAENNLGLLFTDGGRVPKNSEVAAGFFLRAAEHGNAQAESNLGAMYFNGEGVAKDAVEAERWIRKAAEQGNAYGQENLGVLYATGAGVPKDLVKAHVWLSIAIANGQKGAARNLTIIEEDMTQEQLAAAKMIAKQALEKLQKN